MTESNAQRIEKLATEVLSIGKAQLLVKYRFLDRALYLLKPQANDLLPLTTDGERLYYQPLPLLQTYREEKGYAVRVWGHMIMHCLFRHMFVGPGVDPEMWDLASDIATEAVLQDLSIRQLQGIRYAEARAAELQNLSQMVKTLTAEKIYRYLLDHPQNDAKLSWWKVLFSVDDHAPWHSVQLRLELANKGSTGRDGQKDGKDNRKDGENRSDTTMQAALWKEISEQLQVDLDTFEKQQHGDQSGNMHQLLEAVNREQCDYRQFLKRFATRTEVMKLSPDEFDYVLYTYGLSMYRDMPLIEPLEYRDDQRIREMVIAIDTSGSVAGDLVQQFLQKTFTILKQEETFDRRFVLHIIQCDAEIQEDAVITNQEEFDQYLHGMVIKGLGGTDFRPVFRYVEHLRQEKQLRRIGGLLYFTDGYGYYPERMPDYPTAFIFLEKDEYIFPQVPPWAIRVVLEKDNATVFDRTDRRKQR